MTTPRKTDTLILAAAMEKLSRDIYCEDGVATAAIAEAAERLVELHSMKTKSPAKRKSTASRTAKAVGPGLLVSPSDSEMLDWLDKQGAHYGWSVQLPADYPNVRDAVFVCRNTSGGHATIRAAIAARMPNVIAQQRAERRKEQ